MHDWLYLSKICAACLKIVSTFNRIQLTLSTGPIEEKPKGAMRESLAGLAATSALRPSQLSSAAEQWNSFTFCLDSIYGWVFIWGKYIPKLIRILVLLMLNMFTFFSQVGETMYFLFCPACRWVVEMLSQQRIMLQDRKIAPTLFGLRSMTMTSTHYIKKTKTK